ncbi:MAG: hypothetical protein JWP63_4823 [Candidatus Solibacter sp.]|nr:hypothetical protein [Candidatus Solibacter sp.]
MHAIDTNVLVRLIARDDLRQTESAESFVAKGAWVPGLVLAEAMWVLGTVYRLNAKDQAKAIQMLLDHRDLVLQDRETVSAALQLFRAKPALGFSDCLVIESARKAGHLPLGTFYRNLGKVQGAQKL